MNDEQLLEKFEHWRVTLAKIQGGRPEFRDQTPESMLGLYHMVQEERPDMIIEIGTNYGLSTRVWLEATYDWDIKPKILAIDWTFRPLAMTQDALPMRLDLLCQLEKDVTTVDLVTQWQRRDARKVLLYFDCHGVGPVNHTLQAARELPTNSLVVFDDMWYSEEELTEDNLEPFFKEHVSPQVDNSCPVMPQSYAPYWEGGSFFGFDEVGPIMQHVNALKIRVKYSAPRKFLWWRI